jgi:hypothetical protein
MVGRILIKRSLTLQENKVAAFDAFQVMTFFHILLITIAHGFRKRKQARAFKHSDLQICLERATGIEPASSAWKAGVLPLNYARVYGRDDRI